MTRLGVAFSMKPMKAGPTTVAVFDDICGNRIQLFQPPGIVNPSAPPTIKIRLNSVMVGDQEKALRFYIEVLGFLKKLDIPVGGGRWITGVSPDERDGMELVLEPIGLPAAQIYQSAFLERGYH